jgi:DNA-directed RNA polymerase subunit RPC12/RpoP
MHRIHKVGGHVKRKFEATCTECGKHFVSKDFFLAHMFREHGQDLPGLKKIQCPHCPEIFHVKSGFQTHMMSQHAGEKLACPDCDYVTSFSGNLCKHRNNVHRKGAKRSEPVQTS